MLAIDTPDLATMNAAVARLADYCASEPGLFVLTGAGCSTASGIPDYRDTDGQWKHSQPVQYQDFLRSEAIRKFYWARSMIGWPRMAAARPGAAHHALALLESGGYVHQLVTQNVDGLHQGAGSRRVIDLHGRLATVECLECRMRVSRTDLQERLKEHNPQWLGQLAATTAPDGDAELDAATTQSFVVPDCELCGGILKPSVVFFGESVPKGRVARAFERLSEARALLTVGSSLMVYSGYRFCRAAQDQGKPIVAVNRGRTRADPELAFKLEGDCGEILSQLTARLGLDR